MNIATVKSIATSAFGRGGLLLKKHSPEILVVTGIVGLVGSGVLACKATLKAESVVDTAKEKFDKITYAKQNIDKEEYTETDAQKDTLVVYVQTAVDFLKLYGPSVTLAAASIFCILASQNIMKQRNVALAAAYKAIETSFDTYRNRVRAEYGDERELQIKRGTHTEIENVVEVDENGKKVKAKKVHEVTDPNTISQYAKFFDEASSNWQSSSLLNCAFVTGIQNYMNDLLKARGHVFLNEAYDALGIPRTPEGQVVGWVKGMGDDFVDFGIYEGSRMKTRDFVNGYEKSILLDFNVAGVIYQMI